MMSFKEKLAADLKQAMKDKDHLRKDVVTMIRSSIKQVEVDERTDCTDEDVLKIISKQVKQRKDSLDAFEKAQRQDLIEQTRQELDILAGYLPEPLSENELKQIIQNVLETYENPTMKDMGKIMSSVMEQTKGRAEGKTVNALVRQTLS